jgi:hypothetical protein
MAMYPWFVVWLSVCNDEENNALFDDEDAVKVPSYKAVARGGVVCAPAGSSGPDIVRTGSRATRCGCSPRRPAIQRPPRSHERRPHQIKLA